MNSLTLRQFWSMVEQTQTNVLLELSDRDLMAKLQEQFEQHRYVGDVDISLLREYIQVKIPLIRDLAAFKMNL